MFPDVVTATSKDKIVIPVTPCMDFHPRPPMQHIQRFPILIVYRPPNNPLSSYLQKNMPDSYSAKQLDMQLIVSLA